MVFAVSIFSGVVFKAHLILLVIECVAWFIRYKRAKLMARHMVAWQGVCLTSRVLGFGVETLNALKS